MLNLSPKLTAAGLALFPNGLSGGASVAITHVAIGSQSYTPTGTETALKAEFARFPVSGGSVPGSTQAQVGFTITNTDPQNRSTSSQWIGEIGFYVGTTLLAILSKPAPALFYKTQDIDIPIAYTLDVSALPAGSVTINSTASPAALSSLISAHAAQSGAHPDLIASIKAANDKISAYQLGQSAGVVGFDTLANLNANLNFAANTIAYVTNDATSANNTTYRKVGASGTGSWLASSASPVSVLQSYVNGLLDTSVSERSGYGYALVDALDKIVFGIKPDGTVVFGKGGDVISRVAANEATAAELDTMLDRSGTWERSGYAWALVDAAGKVALGVDVAGNLLSKGQKIIPGGIDSATLTQIQADIANNKKWVTPNGFAQFGDSMTPGVVGPLGTLLGKTVQNGGVGGQVSSQIAARFGGVVSYLTVQNNTIPASGGVAVTGITQTLHNNQGPGDVTGTLAGIKGVLSCTFDANGAITSTTFTRSSAGTATYVDPETPFIVDTSDLRDFKTVILWLGRNNTGQPETIKADVKACVDFLKTQDKRFVILSVCNGQYAAEYIGGATYNTIIGLNNDLKKMYPHNFIDIRKVLVRSYDPAQPQDVTDFNNDTTPTSLRVDSVHLNTAGNQIVANTIYNFLQRKGWLS